MKKLLWSTASSLTLLALIGLADSRVSAAPQSPPSSAERPQDTSTRDAKDAGDQNAPRDTNKGDAQKEDKDRPRDADRARDDSNRDSRDGDRDRNARDANRDRDSRDGDRTDERDRQDGDRDRVSRNADRDRGTRDADRDRNRTDAPDRGTSRDARDSRPGHRSAQELGLSFDRITERGLPVGRLTSDSVFAKAGLQQGDVILSVNGKPLRIVDDFDRFVFAGPRNERVKIIVWRDRREEVIFLEPSDLYVEERTEEYRPSFGIDYDDRYPDRIVILRVHPDSPAFAAGLRAGDVITTWNGARIVSAEDFVKTIRGTQPGTVKFEYLRDSKNVGAEARFNRREARRDSRR